MMEKRKRKKHPEQGLKDFLTLLVGECKDELVGRKPMTSESVERLGMAMFGNSLKKSLDAGTCIACNGDAVDFSIEEYHEGYRIQGMCEPCQKSLIT